MQDLKELVGMIANLPSLAVWVLAGFLVYKLAVIGSVYGVIRYIAGELFSWLKQRKVETKEIRAMLDGMVISSQLEPFIAQLHRLRGKGVAINSPYLHDRSVQWLKEAIDAKERSEQAASGS